MMDDFVRRPRPAMDVKSRSPTPVTTRPDTPKEPVQTPAADPMAESAAPEPAVLPPSDNSQAKVRAPVLAIVAALLVSAGLIGLTVFAYMKNKDDEKPPADTATTQVSEQDIDDANGDIDETLDSLNDTTDFSESDVTDETLGL